MPKLNIAFFGTPELVIPILEELESAGLLPKVIVTGKDEPQGRKMLVQKPAPKIWAEQKNIPTLQPEKIDTQFLEEFKKYDIDLGIVVAYGKILPKTLLELPRLGMVNVHYSLLPKYRGATPVESAILNGDDVTGVVIQKMVFALDAGDVIEKEEVQIGEKETAPELRNRLNEIAKKLLVKAVGKIADGTVSYEKQNDAKAMLCKKIKKEDGLLDLASDPIQNYRKFRAYYGWPGTYFFTEKNAKRIRVVIKEASLKNDVLEITRVIPEGKKEMSYKDFLAGFQNK
ncbi:MAG: methionyl-tRNA formyltransferase [Candidatus Pacebacteria bacterium]|nr:methionyl-tRNA formyltransferase [Candidatus Paceibacterota bacterium]MDD5357329.1 methionyl-tRNA formyltransferase [Candidatus Paceibacterota bacterium]